MKTKKWLTILLVILAGVSTSLAIAVNGSLVKKEELVQQEMQSVKVAKGKYQEASKAPAQELPNTDAYTKQLTDVFTEFFAHMNDQNYRSSLVSSSVTDTLFALYSGRGQEMTMTLDKMNVHFEERPEGVFGLGTVDVLTDVPDKKGIKSSNEVYVEMDAKGRITRLVFGEFGRQRL